MQEKTKIMIVDDNLVVQGLLKGVLQKDYVLATALDSRECKEKFPVFLPDIVLLDIMISEDDGYKICKWIRDTYKELDPVVVIISGQTRKDEILMAYKVGADDYVTKPFEDGEVQAKVRVFSRLKAVKKQTREHLKSFLELSDGVRQLTCGIQKFGGTFRDGFSLSEVEKKNMECLGQAWVDLSQLLEGKKL